jgi:hypothetical protein
MMIEEQVFHHINVDQDSKYMSIHHTFGSGSVNLSSPSYISFMLHQGEEHHLWNFLRVFNSNPAVKSLLIHFVQGVFLNMQDHNFIAQDLFSYVPLPSMVWDPFKAEPDMIRNNISFTKTVYIPLMKTKIHRAINHSPHCKDYIPVMHFLEDSKKRLRVAEKLCFLIPK